jgi:hypothetical protein
MNLVQFIETYGDAITQAVLRTYPPVFTARNRDEWGFDLRRLRRRPLGAQCDASWSRAAPIRRPPPSSPPGRAGVCPMTRRREREVLCTSVVAMDLRSGRFEVIERGQEDG